MTTTRSVLTSPLSAGQRLARGAAAAAELRAYHADPDVVALRVEQIRTQVQRLMWAGIALGLCFTMTNVQAFAAAGAPVGSGTWLAAWLLDPTVSLVLLAVVRAEQVTARWQVPTGVWPRVAKWALLAATYVMNTWASWAAGSVAGVVLHSVPPLVVVIAAEAVTDLQHALTECVHRARTAAADRQVPGGQSQTEQARAGAVVPTAAPTHPAGGHPAPGERPPVDTHEHGMNAPRERLVNATGATVANTPSRAAGRSGRRTLLADYVREARAAWAPGVAVSPAWVRQVTGCSRGLSPKVAAALNAELAPRAESRASETDQEGRAA